MWSGSAMLRPELVWGLFTRGLGSVFLCAFVSIGLQIGAVAGSSTALPVARKLAPIRHDFPGWRRFAYFPTLLWIDAGDRALQLIAWGGAVAAGVVIYGGALSR